MCTLSGVQLFVTPWTIACQAPLSMGILQTRLLEWVVMPSSRGSSQLRSPVLQADSLLSEPPGKPKNTGVGSQSLLQRILLTQESNQDLLHRRQILTELSGKSKIYVYISLNLVQSYEARTLLPHFIDEISEAQRG